MLLGIVVIISYYCTAMFYVHTSLKIGYNNVLYNSKNICDLIGYNCSITPNVTVSYSCDQILLSTVKLKYNNISNVVLNK